MRSVDEVLVTVNISNPSGTYDMELPSFMLIGELKKKILEALRLMDTRKYGGVRDIELSFNGNSLQYNSTLACNNIWDGSIIDIITVKAR